MSSPRPIPEALLERYLAGDLPDAERAALEQRLEASPEDRARLDALRADSAAYLIKHPPGPLAAKLEAQGSTPKRWAWLLAPLAAVAAGALFFAIPRPAAEPEVTLKGELAFSAWRQLPGHGAERLESGAVVLPGDKVRFEVRAADEGFVAVLSRDAQGRVTVYYPYEGKQAEAYLPKAPILPGAIALDDTPGAEELWALFSRRGFPLAAFVEQLSRGEAPAGKDVASARMTWTKRQGP